jgi:hypothetical protein
MHLIAARARTFSRPLVSSLFVLTQIDLKIGTRDHRLASQLGNNDDAAALKKRTQPLKVVATTTATATRFQFQDAYTILS